MWQQRALQKGLDEVYPKEPENTPEDYRHSLYQAAALITSLEPFGKGWYRGACPICVGGDSRRLEGPSFTIFPSNGTGEQTFTCTQCDEAGDVRDFMRALYSERPKPGNTLTDLGNSERLIARHGGDLRYCHAWRKWLVWDGTRWAIDDRGAVKERAKDTVRSIYAEAGAVDDEGERKALSSHARRSEARQRVEAMISLAESSLPVRVKDLDADPWLLNCQNGTIDTRTGEVLAHDRERLITKLAPAPYDPDAKAPRFEKFLSEVLDGDDDLIGFMRRFAGYSLTGSTEERVFAILYGRGKNGKTTLVEILRAALGDYATTTSTETIMTKKHQGVGNDVAALKGARFVAASEVAQDRHLDEAKVKHLVGNEEISARFLYGEPFDFMPEFTLWLSTNNKPVIRGEDDAIWDRVKMIPFTRRFEGNEADAKLPEKLREELPGVLAWMVQGCLEWQREGGLKEPEKVSAATEGYRAEMDVVAAFVDECCFVGEDRWCNFANLYDAYDRWCLESHETPQKKRRFGDSLTERGYERFSGPKNVARRKGIALRHDGGEDPPKINDPEPKSEEEPLTSAPSGAEVVNPAPEGLTMVNPQNPCKTEDSVEAVNEVNPDPPTFPVNPSRREVSGKSLTTLTSLTQREEQRGSESPSAAQAERIRQLRHEGMSASNAEAEVLGYWDEEMMEF